MIFLTCQANVLNFEVANLITQNVAFLSFIFWNFVIEFRKHRIFHRIITASLQIVLKDSAKLLKGNLNGYSTKVAENLTYKSKVPLTFRFEAFLKSLFLPVASLPFESHPGVPWNPICILYLAVVYGISFQYFKTFQTELLKSLEIYICPLGFFTRVRSAVPIGFNINDSSFS